MRFSFVGTIEINGQDAKVPGFRDINTSKATGTSMSLTCVAEQNNRAFMECAGFKNDTIKTFDTDNNKIEVKWNDREDADIIRKVANYGKNVITLNGQRYEFLSAFDFVNFVREHADEIKGKEYTITGRIQKNEYNGSITDRFIIQNMFEVEEEKRHQLRINGEFFFSADSVDLSDWKEEKKIIFNGYTQEYMSKDHPKAYVERTLIFDCGKIDFTNENHLKILALRLGLMGLNYDKDSDKIKVNLKKNTYYVQNVIISYQNGAQAIDFDESQLTPTQKQMVELGLKTVNDFRPAGQMFGTRVKLMKLVDFDARGKYDSGYVVCDDTAKEFEENIYMSVKPESEDELSNAMNPPEETKSDDDDGLDDLFG